MVLKQNKTKQKQHGRCVRDSNDEILCFILVDMVFNVVFGVFACHVRFSVHDEIFGIYVFRDDNLRFIIRLKTKI